MGTWRSVLRRLGFTYKKGRWTYERDAGRFLRSIARCVDLLKYCVMRCGESWKSLLGATALAFETWRSIVLCCAIPRISSNGGYP